MQKQNRYANMSILVEITELQGNGLHESGKMMSPSLNSIFDLSAIVLISIGAFLCWWNRKSRSTITKADSAPVDLHFAESQTGKGKYIIVGSETTGLSKVDDTALEDVNN